MHEFDTFKFQSNVFDYYYVSHSIFFSIASFVSVLHFFVSIFHISFHFALSFTISALSFALCHLWIDHQLKSGSIGLWMIFFSSFDFASHLFIYLFFCLPQNMRRLRHFIVSCSLMCCPNDSHFLVLPFPLDLILCSFFHFSLWLDFVLS